MDSRCWSTPDPLPDGAMRGDASSVDACVLATFYRDHDGDGYGDPMMSTQACSVPHGYAANSDDCDDTLVSVNMHAIEVCDELDNDCDHATDESLPVVACYADADMDGAPSMTVASNGCRCPSGTTTASSAWDCQDMDASVHPGEAQYFGAPYGRPDGSLLRNSFDYDCDGVETLEPMSPCALGIRGGSCPAGFVGPDSYAAGSVHCASPIGYRMCNADCSFVSVGTRPLGCR